MIEVTSDLMMLRLVSESDIDSIYRLRSERGDFLNNTGFTQESNRSYINEYRAYVQSCMLERKALNSYYFSIDINDQFSGTVRLYDIDYNNKAFTWGSWILSKGGGYRAIISAILVYAFAFDYLYLEKALLDVHKHNIKVISFHEKTGAIYQGEDEENIYFMYTRTSYQHIRERYSKYLGTIQVRYTL